MDTLSHIKYMYPKQTTENNTLKRMLLWPSPISSPWCVFGHPMSVTGETPPGRKIIYDCPIHPSSTGVLSPKELLCRLPSLWTIT